MQARSTRFRTKVVSVGVQARLQNFINDRHPKATGGEVQIYGVAETNLKHSQLPSNSQSHRSVFLKCRSLISFRYLYWFRRQGGVL
jgi:hypothetical protein